MLFKISLISSWLSSPFSSNKLQRVSNKKRSNLGKFFRVSFIFYLFFLSKTSAKIEVDIDNFSKYSSDKVYWSVNSSDIWIFLHCSFKIYIEDFTRSKACLISPELLATRLQSKLIALSLIKFVNTFFDWAFIQSFYSLSKSIFEVNCFN